MLRCVVFGLVCAHVGNSTGLQCASAHEEPVDGAFAGAHATCTYCRYYLRRDEPVARRYSGRQTNYIYPAVRPRVGKQDLRMLGRGQRGSRHRAGYVRSQSGAGAVREDSCERCQWHGAGCVVWSHDAQDPTVQLQHDIIAFCSQREFFCSCGV